MNSDNIWLDPLYLDDLLSEEEKSIRKTTHDYCDKYLLPIVIKDNRKHYFDKNIKIAKSISESTYQENILKPIKSGYFSSVLSLSICAKWDLLGKLI